MQSVLTKWGNSFGIRIPKAFMKQLAISCGESVNINLSDNKITISKSKTSLEELLKYVKKDNIHKEFDTGSIIGKEIW